jgi:sulfur carrier protein
MGVRLTVNGEPREVPDGATVDALVASVMGQVTGRATGQAGGIAAAVNGEVVPRGAWAGSLLRDGDQVEVVTAVQGG